MQTLEEYCRPFKNAVSVWPKLPLPADRRAHWWDHWLASTAPDQRWTELSQMLPQLLLQPGTNVRSSEAYQRLVLRGQPIRDTDRERARSLKDPTGFKVTLAEHPTGAVPVLDFRDHDDFVHAVRCLAHRCEAVPIMPAVHAQAISGLIHWGLIRTVDKTTRCQILLLHRAPYASLAAENVMGNPDPEQWLNQSQIWRREHELAHIACMRLVGEMRLNLYDELIADALGMLASLGRFQADLFRLALGLTTDGDLHDQARAHVYLAQLDPEQRQQACRFVLDRAQELEQFLNQKPWPVEPMSLLRQLTRGRLNQPFTVDIGSATDGRSEE